MKSRGRKSLAGNAVSFFAASALLSIFAILVSGQTTPRDGTVYPQNQTVLNGSSVTFPCVIPGANSSLWRDENNHQILNSPRITVYEFELRISPVDYRSDQHGYYCVGLSNTVEISRSPTAYLNVLYAEEDFQQDLPSELEVYAGEDGIFTCLPPQANPPFLNWTWFKGLNESKVMLQSVSGNVTVNGARLTIHSAMSEDAGFYSCSVDNGHFNRTSRNSQLKVLAPRDATVTLHSVIPVPAKVYAVPGSSYTLMCNASVNAEPESAIAEVSGIIVWREGGRRVGSDADGRVQLNNFDSSQAGDYICTVTLQFRDNMPMEISARVRVELATIDEDISITPSEVTRGRGNYVNFTCQLPRANPAPSVRWLKNNEVLVSSSRLVVDQFMVNISVLELSDAGIYTCVANNVAGNRSTTVTLAVEDYPNVTVNGGEVAYAKESSNVKLSCQSSSPNASRYKWYFEQELIVDGAEYTVSKPTGNELCIKNFSASQIGEYVCVAAEDSVHVPRNGSTSVQFTPQLYIKYPPVNQTFPVGTDVTLSCEFRAHYANPVNNRLELKWFFMNPELMNSSCGCIYTPSPEGRSELVIRNVSVHDDGEYTCKAILNGTEEVVERMTLSVTIPVYFVKKPPATVMVNRGASVSIECLGGGHPPPTVYWIKDGSQVTGNGTLMLSNVQDSNAGKYVCFVIGRTITLRAETNVVITTFVGLNLPTDTIIVIVVGLVALLLYLLIIIIILCTCAQCCRARLRKKHTEVLQMEAEVLRANRKTQDVKDNSAILRQTPAFTSAIATTSFAIPPSPSPSGSRRTETVVSVDAPMAYSIPTPRSSVPTTVTEPIQLPNFSRRNLKLGDKLGEGEFGPIFLATAYNLATDDSPMLVAVKVWMHPRDEDEENADYDLLNFYSQMRLRFDNIASIVGMCTDVEPFYIIYEYLDRGDLKQFLQDCRPDEIGIPTLTQENLLHIVKQVANGMAYLASQRIIHGDLAARSCIVSSDLRVKVADLGIGHDVYREDYYDNGEQLLPVRWMPPEILQTAEFTLHSDMWSFGVFCWEVFTFGRLPYEDVTDEEVLRLIPQGLRLEVPEEGCPIPLYTIMRECWNPHPEARPKFSRLVVSIIDLNLD